MASSKKTWVWTAVGVVLLFPVVGIGLLFLGVPLADVRPAGTVPSKQARVWYHRAMKAHGGLARWKQIEEARFHMTAQFGSGVLRRVLGPFGANRVELRWRYKPSARMPLEIKEGDARKPLALYRLTKGGAEQVRDGVRSADPWRFPFFARSIRHLLDFVFAMRSADVLHWARGARWEGRTYVRLYMTWGDPKPNKRVDQYVLWINKKTHLLDRFDCTGRAVMPWIPSPFLKARVEFRGYRKVGDFQVPATIRVYRGASQTLVHGYQIHKASFQLGVPSGARQP